LPIRPQCMRALVFLARIVSFTRIVIPAQAGIHTG